MERKKINMIIIGSVVGVLLIGTYIYFGTPLIKNMLGGNKPTTQQIGDRSGRFDGQQMGKGMQPILDELVKDGTLTKEKADALTTYLNTTPRTKPEDGKRGFQNPFAGAVEKGIITQEESDKITSKFRANRPARPDSNGNGGAR